MPSAGENTDDEIVSALSAYATPLSSLDPTTAMEAPAAEGQALDSLVADADVIGLGEATHGTREWFQLKHRVVRSLIQTHDIRTIALETDFATTLAINAFVQERADSQQSPFGVDTDATATDTLDAVELWVWKTEGMAGFLQWLREFNADQPGDKQVRFHGISLNTPANPADALHEYLQTIDAGTPDTPDAPEPIVDNLGALATADFFADETDTQTLLDKGIAVADSTRTWLDTHREQILDMRREQIREYQIARQLCRHLEQNCEWNRTRLSTPGFDPDAFEQRDRFMAENVSWCLDTDPGSGVVVWAHNTHVKRGSFDLDHEWAQGTTMGEQLHREYGSRYRPIGTDFARGQYRAVADAEDPDDRQIEIFTIDSPPSGSLTATLAAIDAERVCLDLRAASGGERLAAWFDTPRCLRGISALVDPAPDNRVCDMETNIPDSFDGIYFVEQTQPSVPVSDESAKDQ